jgi:hypothetical protein
MFADRDAFSNPCEGQAAGFASCWKMTRALKSEECQTEQQSSNEMGSQSKESSDVETQTSEFEKKPSEAANPLEDPKFYKFVMAAVPMLERELESVSFFLIRSQICLNAYRTIARNDECQSLTL